jgi:hypothetical protein
MRTVQLANMLSFYIYLIDVTVIFLYFEQIMQSNIKYCMQLVHNGALLDSSIFGLARCARSSIDSTRPIKHFIMDLLHK